ncbi:NB-ARC domain containing protein, partial [Parasponia andersonii]
HHDVASKIRHINKSLYKIKERGLGFGLRPSQQGSSNSTKANASSVDPRMGSLFIEEEELVGISPTVNKVKTSLVEGTSTHLVISVVGEEGIGKMTLAKKVYKMKEKQHFETSI